MKQKIILLLLCIFNIFVVDAQVKTKYYHKGNVAPVMSQFIPQKQSSTVTKAMPSFNVDSLKNEDEKKNGLDIPFRFGKDFEVNFSLKDGIWEYNDYGRLWALCVESKGASSLNFIFKDFYLPESAELIIENEDRTVIYGPVTSNTIPKNGVFLTDVIRGDNVKILLFEPFKCMGKSSLTINKVIHGYRDINSYYGTIGSSNPCNIDVACYPEYEKESNAIGLVLLSSGYEWCSGALLMSTDILYKPYFLTAFHCIDMNQDQTLSDTEISDAQDWMFKFMYRKESCNGTDIISGITYNGSIFRAAWNQTDFALVELGQDLPNNENLYWLGWDRSGETPSCGVGIHHPAGDLMKISIEEQSFSKTGWNGNLNQNHWQVNFDDGIYEGGSSGSPILNHNCRVVGQLHGGPIASNICNRTIANYGMFHLSWNGGGTNSTKLSNWLDPLGTSVMTMNGCSPLTFNIHGNNVIVDYDIFSLPNISSELTTSWSINNSSFILSPSGNNCTVTYINGNQYDTAVLTATIMRNNIVVKTLTKEITHVGNIIGNGLLCGTGTYSTITLPDSLNVTWSHVNSAFTLTPSGNNCTVSYNQSTPTNTVVDTLKATVSRNGNTLTILSKEIYVHGTNLNIVGSQVTSSMSGQLVQNEFAINTSTAVNNTIYADSISLVGDCEITMTSERFKGMDISFSGAVQPTNYQRTGNTITFTPPTSINEYYMTLVAENSSGCSDFDVVFTISSDDNAQLSSFFLALSLDQSQLYLTLQDAAGTPWQQGTWNFTITNVITGQQVHSQQVVGPSATVNISSYASGLYVVNATYDGARYSKKFVKN